LLAAIQHGDFPIDGFGNRDLQALLYPAEAGSARERRRRPARHRQKATYRTRIVVKSPMPGEALPHITEIRDCTSETVYWVLVSTPLIIGQRADGNPGTFRERFPG